MFDKAHICSQGLFQEATEAARKTNPENQIRIYNFPFKVNIMHRELQTEQIKLFQFMKSQVWVMINFQTLNKVDEEQKRDTKISLSVTKYEVYETTIMVLKLRDFYFDTGYLSQAWKYLHSRYLHCLIQQPLQFFTNRRLSQVSFITSEYLL